MYNHTTTDISSRMFCVVNIISPDIALDGRWFLGPAGPEGRWRHVRLRPGAFLLFRRTPQPRPPLDIVAHRHLLHDHLLSTAAMDLQETQNTLVRLFNDANVQFHKMPGSAIILRYIKSSYQDDPVRSAIELFLFLFAVRYMLSPSYSTQKKVQLTEAVCLRPQTGAWDRGIDSGAGNR